ncbi:hypothetical protein SPHINGO8AM_40279 [Sphingomonas sp. 8AM]|nr:hypothetical protein SPHINGO8AM_40279 [Sphingomonas sp. 8AM]
MRAQRSNPERPGRALDCFATLAMTGGGAADMDPGGDLGRKPLLRHLDPAISPRKRRGGHR